MNILSFKLFIAAVLLPGLLLAQLKTDPLFTSHMLLQCDHPLRFWGKNKPGQEVRAVSETIHVNGQTGADSTWMIEFPPRKASADPFSVQFYSGQDSIRLSGLITGDVWICIGQSNMEWPFSQDQYYIKEKDSLPVAYLRLWNPGYAGKNIYGVRYPDSVRRQLNQSLFYNQGWQVCDSVHAASMSAVALYFGRRIVRETKVPVGLVQLAIGGAPLETFINPAALKSHPVFYKKMAGNWLYNDNLPVWVRQRAGVQLAGDPPLDTDEYGPVHPNKPGYVWQTALKHFFRLPVKGIIFYQGESNAQELQRVTEYPDLFTIMMENFREESGQKALPVYYVQLSSIDSSRYKSQFWPLFRDRQRIIMERLPFSGMVVSSDAGDSTDVHPRDKKIVGERLASWALARTYRKKILASGPLPYKIRFWKNRAVIRFHFTGKFLHTADGRELRGFSRADGSAIPARIRRRRVWLDMRNGPSALYYGWSPYTDASLVNQAGLPASTFRFLPDGPGRKFTIVRQVN